MIAADPDAYGVKKCGSGRAGLAPLSGPALEACLTAFRHPETIRACCEDYRAAASIDIAHDDAEGDRRIGCPLLAPWGAHGAIEAHFDRLALWRERADDVCGEALPGGHYLPEELPDMVAERLMAFFSEGNSE